MRNLFHRLTPKAALFLGAFLAVTAVAGAQAIVSGERGAEFTPFVMTTLISPDYGQVHNLGYTVGIDYTRFIHSIVQPSLEFRFTHANGDQVNEQNYAGGLRLQTEVRNFHPYATVLFGQGDITFVHPFATRIDNSFLYSLGGGVDFNVSPHWKVRADYIWQRWNLNPLSLTPSQYSLGLTYRIPFHNGKGR